MQSIPNQKVLVIGSWPVSCCYHCPLKQKQEYCEEVPNRQWVFQVIPEWLRPSEQNPDHLEMACFQKQQHEAQTLM